MTTGTEKFGVYFLSNDLVADWLVAALESLRELNPAIPVSVIPFDERLDVVRTLADRYRFQIMPPVNEAFLASLADFVYPDQPISRCYFKKYSSFWGPYETFLFLDSDTLTLSELLPYFEAFESSPYRLSYFDADIHSVYRDRRFREMMRQKYNSPGFNSGGFFSRRNALTPESFLRGAKLIIPNRLKLYPTFDQAFLNFCVDINGLEARRMSVLHPGISMTTWSEFDFELRGGRYHLNAPERMDHGRPIPSMHFAGIRTINPAMKNFDIFMQYRSRNPLPISWKVAVPESTRPGE